MSLPPTFDPTTAAEVVAPGTLLRQRNEHPSCVLYIDSGRVLLVMREAGQIRHQLGMVEGPTWLDAAFVLCHQPCPVDMVAEGCVQVRRMGLSAFLDTIAALPEAAQHLFRDMALGYCQQTQWAVSRLAQDAEARCAQWLLRHAHHDGSGALRVTLHQRKRMIAAQLGIAPETFSRVLRHLREHGLIAGTGNVLALPQPRALQLVAGS